MTTMSRTLPRVLAGFAFALLALLSPTASAQKAPAHPDKPLLWKIEGKGLKAPSYLFGTIHLSKGPTATLHPLAQKAFDSSAALYTEVPLDTESQQAVIPLVMRGDGKKLSAAIGKDLSEALDAHLKTINPQLDATPMQALKTWYVAIMLSFLPDQLAGGGKPLDSALWDKATDAGKKTGALETPESQMKGFTELTEADQSIFLSETLKQFKKYREQGIDPNKALVDAYLSGDPAKVAAEMDKQILEMKQGEHKELGERLMARLITDRNKQMASKIADTLKAEPAVIHFFAAGAAHFCSEDSVGQHLQKEGYTVTRVEK